jgi:hypothetical protein
MLYQPVDLMLPLALPEIRLSFALLSMELALPELALLALEMISFSSLLSTSSALPWRSV